MYRGDDNFFRNLIMIGIFLFLLLVLLQGCVHPSNHIKFDPDFHMIDSTTQTLVNSNGNVIPIESMEAERFVCMHEDKVIELYELLRKKEETINNLYTGLIIATPNLHSL